LSKLCPYAKLHISIDHHDAHVYALRAFTGVPFEWEIVADGFGNFNETLSIYQNGLLIHRCFGFNKSIGLLYQYATSYLDLKMNQDEYKLLGYEAYIQRIVDAETILTIDTLSDKFAKRMAKDIIKDNINVHFDLVAGLDALPNIRLKIRDRLDKFLSKIGQTKLGLKDKRIVIAYFIQSIVEKVMTNIIDYYGIKEVALTGGIFMNVKLNNVIMGLVNRISIMPICGDQSGGLGVYHYFNENLKWPEHLFWSKRNLDVCPMDIPKLLVVSDEVQAYKLINKNLAKNKIVNFVTGNGEFGARALGNTTTFALPSIKNVEYINLLNDRSSIMPMAGMIDIGFLQEYTDYEKVFKSLEYMIITLTYKGEPFNHMMGCHHKHPINNTWTNRVQLINSDNKLSKLLMKYVLLINTSFNVHGQPIVLDVDQIIFAHNFQCERDIEDRIITIILR